MKIVHFADVHLGMENYGHIDAKTGLHTRLLDFVSSLNYVLDYAIKEKVDLVLFAGDAYRTKDPSLTHQREFARCVQKIAQAKIPLVLLVGNHDRPHTLGRAHTVEIFHTLKLPQFYVSSLPEIIKIETKEGMLQVATLPYLSPSSLLWEKEKTQTIVQVRQHLQQHYLKKLRNLVKEIDAQLPAILLAHIGVQNAVFSSEQDISISEEVILPLGKVAKPIFSYVALGHIHRFQDLNEGKSPAVVYAGSIDRIDFGEEKEEKGFVLAELEKGRNASYRFIPVPVRKFHTICIEPMDAGQTDIKKVIEEKRKDMDIKGAILRIILKVKEESTQLISPEELRQFFKDAHYFVINKEIVKEAQISRIPFLNEKMSPLIALEKYIDCDQEYKKDRQALLEHARLLMQELR